MKMRELLARANAVNDEPVKKSLFGSLFGAAGRPSSRGGGGGGVDSSGDERPSSASSSFMRKFGGGGGGAASGSESDGDGRPAPVMRSSSAGALPPVGKGR